MRFSAPASGVQCIRALQRAGFVVTQTSELHVTLSGEKGEVRVPFVTFLRPEMLLQILQAAGTNAQVLVFTGELDE